MMKARINRNFLEQTSFDSGQPSGLGLVVHRFQEPGDYAVTLQHEDRVIERLPLRVAEERAGRQAPARKARPEQGQPQPEQEALVAPVEPAQIELSQVRRDIQASPLGELEQPYVVGASGYASFTAQRRQDAAAIVVQRAGKRGEQEVFDSRRLEGEDVFAVTLVRPGTYALKNTLSGAEGKITVAYPQVGKEPYRPPAPVSVVCTEEGFRPANIDLKPAQGVIFRFKVPSRIQIDLVEPDDGPHGPRPQKMPGWRRKAA